MHPSSRPESPGHDKSPDGKWSMKATLREIDIDGKFMKIQSFLSLSTGHLESRICDVVVRLTEGNSDFP